MRIVTLVTFNFVTPSVMCPPADPNTGLGAEEQTINSGHGASVGGQGWAVSILICRIHSQESSHHIWSRGTKQGPA